MKSIFNPIVLLLFGTILSSAAPPPYYRHGHRRPFASPPARYFTNSNGFVPIPYPHFDLYSAETKRSSTGKKYGKKIPLRPFASDEDDYSQEQNLANDYSNESQQSYNSRENDSREYTIGTQIRVQHPITVPKKHTTSYSKPIKSYHNQSPYKASQAYSEVNLSTESYAPEASAATYINNNKKYQQQSSRYTQSYDADPFHVIPAPKATAASSTSYNVYEPDTGSDYKPTLSTKTKSDLLDRYKHIASKKQIEAYLQDQQKLLNEALKLQLLSNPNLKELLKSANKNKESIEDDYESDPLPKLTPPQRGSGFSENFKHKPARPRRRPEGGGGDRKRPGKGKHVNGKPKRKYRSPPVLYTV